MTALTTTGASSIHARLDVLTPCELQVLPCQAPQGSSNLVLDSGTFFAAACREMEARLKIRESSNYRGKFFSPISHQGTKKTQPHTLFGVVDMQPHNGKGNMYIHLSHVRGAEKRLDLT
jgi:hypothetical protein